MFIHSGHDFTAIIHICIISVSLLLGSILRSKVKILQKYLIPAPMLGGLLLFFFYNFGVDLLHLNLTTEFLDELIFHLLNISFIAMQLRIPTQEKTQRKGALWQNVSALLFEYGAQVFVGFLIALVLFKKMLPGPSCSLGLTLVLGFELGPGQAETISRVWERAPYFVQNASDVALAMAAIGFVIGSIIGVVLINRAAKKGWISKEYVEKLRNRKVGNGFFKDRNHQLVGSRQTTASESMDTMTLHIALVMFTYLLSYLAMAGIEGIVAKFVGGKVLEAVEGLWGINFVFSSLIAILVRKVIIATKCEHIIDNGTLNRIDGIAVDFTIAACLGAISIVALQRYWWLIIVLTLGGVFITCFVTPWLCSRLFTDFSFFRFLMIFGTANGTLPTALSLVRVVDPDFETPVAQDYVNSTGVMFVFALPIVGLGNLAANGKPWLMVAIGGAYVVVSLAMYIKLAGKRAFIKPKEFFYIEDN